MRSVLRFKCLKHDLYNWSQVLSVINKLVLMISLFFLLSSIFQAIVQAPPALASISSILLERKDLQISTVGMPKTVLLIYTLQITNSLFAGLLAVIGIA